MKVLWPDRWPLDLLMRRREEIGSLEFDREYQCEPVTSESSILPFEVFSLNFDPEYAMASEVKGDEGYSVVSIGVDFAISESIGADYFVIFVLAVNKVGDRYPVYIFRDRGLPYISQLETVKYFGTRMRADIVMVENNAFQKIYEQELIRTSGLPIRGFHTGSRKSDPAEGIPHLKILLENRKYHIPRGDAFSVSMTDTWISEGISFGWDSGRLEGFGEHDDIVLAWWFAEMGLRELMVGKRRVSAPAVHPGRPGTHTHVEAPPPPPKQSEPPQRDVMLDLCKLQGYVPKGCLLPGLVVVGLINSGRDPCKGCEYDRSVCGGR